MRLASGGPRARAGRHPSASPGRPRPSALAPRRHPAMAGSQKNLRLPRQVRSVGCVSFLRQVTRPQRQREELTTKVWSTFCTLFSGDRSCRALWQAGSVVNARPDRGIPDTRRRGRLQAPGACLPTGPAQRFFWKLFSSGRVDSAFTLLNGPTRRSGGGPLRSRCRGDFRRPAAQKPLSVASPPLWGREIPPGECRRGPTESEEGMNALTRTLALLRSRVLPSRGGRRKIHPRSGHGTRRLHSFRPGPEPGRESDQALGPSLQAKLLRV